jgi:1-acyl-sn-glycerol-3-phosphate acyltransferase
LSALEIPINDPRDRLHYPLQETRLRKIVMAALGFVARTVIDLEVDGLENLPRSEGLIVAANHLTNFDILPLQMALPRPIFFMGKAELFQNRLAHTFLRALCAFPVYRGAHDDWALLHARQILEAGQVVGIFPEGTRSQGRGLKVAKTGAARLALATGCPISPVAIDGIQRLFKQFPHRTKIHITVCELVLPQKGELPLALTDRLMFLLARNLPSSLKGVYGQSPAGF